jgi:hypothetical protein
MESVELYKHLIALHVGIRNPDEISLITGSRSEAEASCAISQRFSPASMQSCCAIRFARQNHFQ